jgi:protein phosphatase
MINTLKVNGVSCRGLKRDKNEDAICIEGKVEQSSQFISGEINLQHEGTIILLADGMGGHVRGEVASREAVSVIWDEFSKKERKFDLINTIKSCHYHLRGLSRDEELVAGLGTTIVGLKLTSKSAQWFNVGDSRGYLFRDEKLIQLTTDDSFSNPRHSGILTQCLGGNQPSAPQLHHGTNELLKGDIFLLVSDGVTDVVDDIMIANFLKSSDNCLAVDLVTIANERGSTDDTSVIIGEVG